MSTQKRKWVGLLAAFSVGCGASPPPVRSTEPAASPVIPERRQVPTVEPSAERHVAWPSVSSADFRDDSSDGDTAVVVAIEDYTFLPDVPGAFANGQDWYTYLTKIRGIPLDRVRLLTNAQATDFAIRKATEEMGQLTPPHAKSWFVYVGHGAPNRDGSDGLLVAADAQQTTEGIENRSVEQSSLLQRLGAGGGTPLMIIDACFSGRRPDGQPLIAGLQPTTVVKTTVPTGALLLSAAASDQYAGPLPGGDRPAFSYLILGALRGWADDDSDGNVTAGEAWGYTAAILRSMLAGSRQQVPELQGQAAVVLARSREDGPALDALVSQLHGVKPLPAKPPSGPEAPAPVSPAPMADVAPRSEGFPWVPVVIGGAGVLALGSGIFVGYQAKHKHDQAAVDCADDVCPDGAFAQRESAVHQGNIATAVSVGGIALIGLGGLLWLAGGSEGGGEEAKSARLPADNVAIRGVALRGTQLSLEGTW